MTEYQEALQTLVACKRDASDDQTKAAIYKLMRYINGLAKYQEYYEAEHAENTRLNT